MHVKQFVFSLFRHVKIQQFKCVANEQGTQTKSKMTLKEAWHCTFQF